jgi:hypothetical protein
VTISEGLFKAISGCSINVRLSDTNRMDAKFFQFITENTQLISVLVIVGGGVISFIKWLDTRNRELREKRYAKYMDLISTISGANHPDGSTPRMTEQIAAVWFLLEYKEYTDITYKVFSYSDLDKLANKPWTEHVAPNIRLLLQEIAPQVWLSDFLRFPFRSIAAKLRSSKSKSTPC